jgi:hypothetical protein
MRVQLWPALSLTLLLAACDNSEPAAPPRSISVRSEAQNSLHRLSEMNLKVALRRAIYDSGKACQTVTQAGYVQEYGNLSMWTASCRSGRSFAIFVGPDGTAQVRDCREMETLRLPACTIRRRAGSQPG